MKAKKPTLGEHYDMIEERHYKANKDRFIKYYNYYLSKAADIILGISKDKHLYTHYLLRSTQIRLYTHKI